MNQTTFSFPQMVSRTSKKTILSSENKSINECLGILLRTRPGELLGDPDWGCLLIERVFRYNGLIVQQLVKEDILNAVSKYEPRITMTADDISIVQNVDRLSIYISYTIKDTNEVNQYNMDITTLDNPYR